MIRDACEFGTSRFVRISSSEILNLGKTLWINVKIKNGWSIINLYFRCLTTFHQSTQKTHFEVGAAFVADCWTMTVVTVVVDSNDLDGRTLSVVVYETA
jgi:hypothetical protein